MDHFFHKCWLEMKHRHPRLRKRMDDIELTVGGLKTEVYDLAAMKKGSEPNEDDSETVSAQELIDGTV